jgi:hypothetical protein
MRSGVPGDELAVLLNGIQIQYIGVRRHEVLLVQGNGYLDQAGISVDQTA